MNGLAHLRRVTPRATDLSRRALLRSGAVMGASAAVYGLDSPLEFAAHHQLGRLVEPDEVAALLAWLCEPDSAAITGAVLPVDAGMTAS